MEEVEERNFKVQNLDKLERSKLWWSELLLMVSEYNLFFSLPTGFAMF